MIIIYRVEKGWKKQILFALNDFEGFPRFNYYGYGDAKVVWKSISGNIEYRSRVKI